MFEPLDEEFYEAKSEDEDKPVLLLFTECYNFKDNVALLNWFRDRYRKPGIRAITHAIRVYTKVDYAKIWRLFQGCYRK